MPDGMTFSENLQNEKRKWKELNGRQRWDYFKSYYMIPTIVILALLIGAITFFVQTVVLRKDIILSGIILNQQLDDEALEQFQTDLLECLDGDPKSEEVEMASYSLSDSSYTTQMVVAANMTAESLDFLFLDEAAFEQYKDMDMLADVGAFISADKVAECESEGRIVTGTWQDTNTEFNAGIDISNTKLVQDNWPGMKMYLCFAVNAPHDDCLETLLDYLDK